MPRTFDITGQPDKLDAVIHELEGVDGVVGVARHRGASLSPPGDILSLQMTNGATRRVLSILDDLGFDTDGSIVASEPRAIIAAPHRRRLAGEANETTWDEMAVLLRQDTNLSVNYLALMTLAGAVAAVGMWSDTLHIVIAAMVIAPAFEPLVRLPFGAIAGSRSIASDGIASVLAGYLLLAAGGLMAVLVLQVIEPAGPVRLATLPWVGFWSTVTPAGVLASIFAAAAGAVVIAGQRSVLTTGVMIALALIPSMAIVGMAVATGEAALAGRALTRWAVDAAVVIMVSSLVLLAKRFWLHDERALG